MDIQIFKKMRIKDNMTAKVLNAPTNYIKSTELKWLDKGKIDFLHLFVSSKDEFEKQFSNVVEHLNTNANVWISYPKSTSKQKYDINRDSLWDLMIPKGWHPVSQISLDETWSAIRIKPNEPEKEYIRPSNIKGSK